MKTFLRISTYVAFVFGGIIALLWYVSSLQQKRKAMDHFQSLTLPVPKEAPVPEEEPEELLPIEAAEIVIKGNRNSKGERIYHLPGGQYYHRVTPVETFSSEEEAQGKGYRKSKR